MKTLVLLLPLVLAPAALAQETAPPGPPPPAPELARFDPLIGTFEGEGTLVMEPGAAAQKWSGTAVGTRILGGHVIQFDETLQTPMGPMEFRSLYGWDGERKRPVSYWVGTMGAKETQIAWADADTLVGMESGFQQGTLCSNRWTMDITKDGYTFTMHSMAGGMAPFQHATGTMKRTQKASTEHVREAAATAQPAEIRALAPMCGTWDIAGMVNMMGMKMDITGRETIDYGFGGAALCGHVEGEPGGYRCDWYIAWSAEDGRYKNVYASNHGEIGILDGWLVDGKLITTAANTQAGVPGVDRGVTEFGPDGIQRAYSDRISGAGETVRTFQGTYKRAAKTSALQFKPGSCCAQAAAAGGACTHPCCVEAAKAGKVCAACNG